jgi:exopolyphosphatase/guanosine-5'-triphosphate,3'-diphosphate pyrophosphatase
LRIGIIDFGTNTLRLNIFEAEDDERNMIYDGVVYSRVVENTVGSRLSQEGIEHIIEGIEEHQSVCRHYRCDRVVCFSTASLRYLENADDVAEQAAFRTGISIRRISGGEEAEYDYLALKRATGMEAGVGCDLGGGSIQVLLFDKNGLTQSASFPLGSSRMAKAHVAGDFPTAEETAAIGEEIRAALKKEAFPPAGGALLAMGGTAKACLKLYHRALHREGGTIPLSELKGMLTALCAEPEESLELLAELASGREKTLAPGMAVLIGAAEALGCDRISVFDVGVRDGLLESLLKEGIPPVGGIFASLLGGTGSTASE